MVIEQIFMALLIVILFFLFTYLTIRNTGYLKESLTKIYNNIKRIIFARKKQENIKKEIHYKLREIDNKVQEKIQEIERSYEERYKNISEKLKEYSRTKK